MQQFKISEAGFKKFRKKWFIINISLMAIVILIASASAILPAKTGEVSTWPFIVPLLLVYFGFSSYRGLKKQKKALLSYSVTISEEGVTREALNTPSLSIGFMEIREIIKTERGGFRVKGVNRNDVIHIPYLIDNPGAVEECLQMLAPVTFGKKDPFYRKYGVLLLFPVVIGMLICVYTVTNTIIVGICAPVLIGLFIWGIL